VSVEGWQGALLLLTALTALPATTALLHAAHRTGSSIVACCWHNARATALWPAGHPALHFSIWKGEAVSGTCIHTCVCLNALLLLLLLLLLCAGMTPD
jgi:hypothetical protein